MAAILRGAKIGSSSLRYFFCSGRIDLQRDHGPRVLEVDGVHVGREDLGMAQGLVDLRLGREQDAHALDRHDRALAHELEDGLRVGRHLGIHAGQRILFLAFVRRFSDGIHGSSR
jgi:hypothetical protein